MKRSKLMLIIPAIAGLSFSLLACTQAPPPPTAQQVLQAKQETLAHKLKRHHVQIVQQGMRLQLILPTDQFFDLQTTEIKPNKIKTLAWVGQYLHNYLSQFKAKPTIHISGHSDKVFTRKDRIALSNQYAQVIAAYLWSHGFSRKQLRIVGFGALEPIASFKTAKGNAYNRRVVIQVF